MSYNNKNIKDLKNTIYFSQLWMLWSPRPRCQQIRCLETTIFSWGNTLLCKKAPHFFQKGCVVGLTLSSSLSTCGMPFFFILGILMWLIVVISHCSSNMHFSNDEWLWTFFMSLFAKHIFSLVKCLLKSLPIFKWVRFYSVLFWLLRFENSFYILDIGCCSDLWFTNVSAILCLFSVSLQNGGF